MIDINVIRSIISKNFSQTKESIQDKAVSELFVYANTLNKQFKESTDCVSHWTWIDNNKCKCDNCQSVFDKATDFCGCCGFRMDYKF